MVDIHQFFEILEATVQSIIEHCKDGIYDQDMVGDAYSFHVHKLFTTLCLRNIKYLKFIPSFANTNGSDILRDVNYASEGAGICIETKDDKLYYSEFDSDLASEDDKTGQSLQLVKWSLDASIL
ncbi:hypothetical protein MTR_2g031820 [Medicago truncatula]|uniref:Uncharacterized protein n=1 Tax=Medicago truncatula TaxID=3880 RepID=A0A072V6W2_MEDTR|nr:hypothetical protein MTR_2g031820 [Medicago truncatula]